MILFTITQKESGYKNAQAKNKFHLLHPNSYKKRRKETRVAQSKSLHTQDFKQ